jgi:saccharopine dehydrogenase-like NADP-dependent oxidoreductase
MPDNAQALPTGETTSLAKNIPTQKTRFFLGFEVQGCAIIARMINPRADFARRD